MPPPDTAPEDVGARRALRRTRAAATGLLAGMGGLTLASYALPTGWAAELLQASAKAGFVGGIADWFAVTALFRHPLGLPIPHTAILPRQKARLGRALGRFLSGHVFTEDEVRRTVGKLDLSAIMARFLSDPEAARPAAAALAGMLPRLLSTVEDGRARRTVARVLPRVLGGAAAGRVVARALRGLVAGGRHQEVLGFLLDELRRQLAAKEAQLQAVVEERVREQGGRLVGWALGGQIARRVLAALNDELNKIGPDNSELRRAFDQWARREIDRLENDPERAAAMGAAIRRVVGHESVQAWVWDVWARMRAALERDAARPGGHTQALLEGAVANLGAVLAHDETARRRLQHAGETVIASLIPGAREQLAEFVASVVAGWDTATITDKLELRVGRDLQYVRVNGTLVGFLVGGLVWAVLSAMFGHVAF